MRRTLWVALVLAPAVAGAERPPVFPEPRQIKLLESSFSVGENTPVLVPENPAPADLALARALAGELRDRYRLASRVQRAAALPAGRFILMGSIANPLVRQFAERNGIRVSRPEGYVLRSGPAAAVVAGSDDAGAFYGMQSLRQLIAARGTAVQVRGAEIEDWPYLPFRGIRMYLPGHENIAFFKRFLRDFMALYKFNKLILEVNGSMRLDRHPEINAGWLDFAADLFYSQRYYPRGPQQTEQNSAHQDTADGQILEKEQVADLVRYAAAQHIEVIPEIPTFTHAYYLLTRHKNFGAITGAEWPDTYCPTDPGIYDLVFDVMDEYIEVMQPKMIHIGHDEMFFPIEFCRCSKDKTPQELFAYDVNRIHEYLTRKGIKVGMYGDHLVEAVRGAGARERISTRSGFRYHQPGALTPDQVRTMIPKDILIFNWFWQDSRAAEGRGEPNEVKLREWGFQQAYANFTPVIPNFARRISAGGIIGGAPSLWAATTEFNIGKDLLMDFLGTAGLMWSGRAVEEEPLSKMVQSLAAEVRERLASRPLPSRAGNRVEPVDIRAAVNSPAGLNPGPLAAGRLHFEVAEKGAVVVGVEGDSANPLPRASGAIPIGADVASIVFLHASTKPAANDMAYRYIHNFPDTADLLGWYEILYEDGFVTTAPLRFGLNILPLTWGEKSDSIAKGSIRELSYAYEADAVKCGGATLFAWEWVNPRFGKVIKEVRLHGTTGFRDTKGKPTPTNSIVLAAISVVKKRP